VKLRKKSKAIISIAASLLALFPSTVHGAGSTVPVFVIDAANPSSFTYTGTTVGSSVTESANSVAGSATNLLVDTTTTSSLVFAVGRYISFSNNVKPDLTNGTSLQIVANLTSTSYDSSWPRVLDMGATNGWGAGYDGFSIQLSQTGQLQVYMNRSGTSSTYTCGTSSNVVVANSFAIYSIQVGTGVCAISVNGSAAAVTTSEATTSYASRIPNTATTMNFRIGSMSNNVQSTLPSGKIRSVILSSGTSATNSVTFMENGGSGYMASQIGSTSANLNANTFTKTGYTLTSWNTAANGTGTSYAPGASYNFASGSAILYAQWTFTPPSLSIAQMGTATYRTTYPISMTINSAGKYTFLESGKRIPGCINLSGTPPTLSCNWRPAKIGAYRITATGVISGSNYLSNSAVVSVIKRSTTR
jgi:hypothetical protein